MSNTMQSRNLTMLVDFYELSMANGYFANGMKDTVAYFDMFFRKVQLFAYKMWLILRKWMVNL